jgi:hypothetical protein
LVTVRKGKLYDAAGKLLDTTNAETAFAGGGGKGIFVMDEFGNIYQSNYQVRGKFHHSSLVAGRPVSASGELAVERGVLKGITRRSGHYQQGPEYLDQFMAELGERGVDLSNVAIGAGF